MPAGSRRRSTVPSGKRPVTSDGRSARLPDAARILVTGGAGFIGSAYVRDVLGRRDGTRITVLDKLTYAGNRANLEAVESDPEQAARFRFVEGDIADPTVVDPLVVDSDAVVNFAAESHVDRSILDPAAFLRTGVVGVHVLLEAVRAASARRAGTVARAGSGARADSDEPGDRVDRVRFLQVSTDEVYGSVAEGRSVETDRLEPRSPYSAAKAAGELLVHSYVATHGIDAVVTRGSNTYGPFHHPEKLIPLFVTNAIDDQPLPLYGDGLQQRDWLYVADHAGAIDHVLRHGATGETYNIRGSAEMTNRDVVAALLDRLGKPWSLVRSVPDRPGHDRRYALDGSKLAALGWENRTSFGDGLAATIDWFRANEPWWRAARSGDWDAYYEQQYGARLAASSEA
jgi:dTDP-glucose 4,6-dehydratase